MKSYLPKPATEVVRYIDGLDADQRLAFAEAVMRSAGRMTVAELVYPSRDSSNYQKTSKWESELVLPPEVSQAISGFSPLARLEWADLIVSSIPEARRKTEPLWYTQIARQIEREDGLVNQRMTWTVTIQAFLFGGLGLSLKPKNDFAFPSVFLIAAFIVSGWATARYGGKGVRAAIGALEHLKNRYLRMPLNERRGLVRPFGAPALHKGASDLIRGLPRLMQYSWAVLGIVFLVLVVCFVGIRYLPGAFCPIVRPFLPLWR